MHRKPLLFVFVFLIACTAPAEPVSSGVPSLDKDFQRGMLVVVSDDGREHTFDIYLATQYEQQKRGLMFVRKMPADVGMLFDYDKAGIRSIWMKNTYIPLDLVFARDDGSVASVIHDTEPLSLQSRASLEPVRYVLELNAGTARRLSIGDKSNIIVNLGDD